MSSEANACKAFFDAHASNTKKVLELLKQNHAGWEALTASSHSPGPVLDHEVLVRAVLHPHHVDAETGELKPSFVSDVKDKGGSCDRFSYRTVEQSIAAAKARAEAKNETRTKDKQLSVVAVSTVKAAEVRAIRPAEVQAFGVYDTGLPDNPAHADICHTVNEGAAAREARLALYELFVEQQLKLD